MIRGRITQRFICLYKVTTSLQQQLRPIATSPLQVKPAFKYKILQQLMHLHIHLTHGQVTVTTPHPAAHRARRDYRKR